MKIEKLPSGSYRVRKMVKGQSIALIFPHKPTKNEVTLELTKRLNASVTPTNAPKKPFRDCATKYMEIKSNVLSPSTKRGYKSILNNLDDSFGGLELSDISQSVVQQYINKLALNHSPKTVKNYHSFIMAVMTAFIPETNFRITLPMPKKRDIEKDYIPTQDDIKAILSISNEEYQIAFLLAAYGLRRSEICALSVEDIRYDSVKVNKAKVQDENKNWIIKEYNKTFDSNRIVPIDPSLKLKERVSKQGYVFNSHPNKLYRYLKRKQDELGLPHFRLHDFRHYMATELHQAGYSDKDIQHVGGWASDYTLKRVYEHDRISKDKELQRKAASVIGGNLI